MRNVELRPLRLATWNMAHLGGTKGELKAKFLAKLANFDILALQDVMMEPDLARSKLSGLFPGHLVLVNAPEKTSKEDLGVALVISRAIEIVPSLTLMDKEHRTITVGAILEEIPTSFSCFYGKPKASTKQEAALGWNAPSSHISVLRTQGFVRNVILGDFNACVNPKVDRSGAKKSTKDEAYTNFLDQMNMRDLVGHCNLGEPAHTYFREEKNGSTKSSRIDSCAISSNLAEKMLGVKNSSEELNKLSDHIPVEIFTRVCVGDIPKIPSNRREILPKIAAGNEELFKSNLRQRLARVEYATPEHLAEEISQIVSEAANETEGNRNVRLADLNFFKKVEKLLSKLQGHKNTLENALEVWRETRLIPDGDILRDIVEIYYPGSTPSISLIENILERIESKITLAKNNPEKVITESMNDLFGLDKSKFFRIVAPKMGNSQRAYAVVDEKGYHYKPDAVKERTREYFKGLLYSENTTPKDNSGKPWNRKFGSEETKSLLKDVMKEFSGEEIKRALFSKKPSSAPGSNLVSYHHLQVGFEVLEPYLLRLFNWILETKGIPKEWETGIIYPIFKSGSALELGNFRGITLLQASYKLFTSVLANRLENIIEEFISPEQAGFKRGNSTFHHLQTLNNVIAHANRRDNKKTVVGVYLDLKKAFDSVKPWALRQALEALNFPEELSTLLIKLMESASARVITPYGLTEEFEVNIGVRQGCPLSPILFILIMQPLINHLKKLKKGYNLEGVIISILAYADDILLLAENSSDLQEMLNVVTEYLDSIDIKINLAKSAHTSNLPENRNQAQVYGLNLPALGKSAAYKYLGVWTCFDGNGKKEWDYILTKTKRTLERIERFKLCPTILAEVINSLVISTVRYPIGYSYFGETHLDEIKSLCGSTIRRSKQLWNEVSYANIFAPKEEGGLGLIDITLDAKGLILQKLINFGIEARNKLAQTTTLALLRWNRKISASNYLLTSYSKFGESSTIKMASRALEALDPDKANLVTNVGKDHIPSKELALNYYGDKIDVTAYYSRKQYSLLDLCGKRNNGTAYHLDAPGTKSKESLQRLKKLFCVENSSRIKPHLEKKLKKIEKQGIYFKFKDSLIDGVTRNENGEIVIFTDGSCKHFSAGAGVYIGDSHPLNLSLRSPGRQTNNAAEIFAAIQAILLFPINEPLEIKSDSMLVVNTGKNGRTSKSLKNSVIKSLRLPLIELLELKRKHASVSFTYVKAHNGNHGNENADKLAKDGTSDRSKLPPFYKGYFIKIGKRFLEGNIRRIVAAHIYKRNTLETEVARKIPTEAINTEAYKALTHKWKHYKKLLLLRLRWNLIPNMDHFHRKNHPRMKSNLCPRCGVIHDIKHALLDCLETAEIRDALTECLKYVLRAADPDATYHKDPGALLDDDEIKFYVMRAHIHRNLLQDFKRDKKLEIVKNIFRVLIIFMPAYLKDTRKLIFPPDYEPPPSSWTDYSDQSDEESEEEILDEPYSSESEKKAVELCRSIRDAVDNRVREPNSPTRWGVTPPSSEGEETILDE
jgi:ribonuclease HI/endonuclease/exonuclease/phosphatase family metal-dependent hydrolase